MDNAIEVNSLSKRFYVATGKNTLFRLFENIVTGRPHYKEMQALKDISFEIKVGEKIGLIGDNGCGKTTLLRIISGVYKQTSGSFHIKGRISGWFQPAVSMHRDLSALENIYLFGAIMGFDRKIMTQKLDDIISFSELKDFLYMPLRDFSTGMVQRLAISIIKEIDSDIILFDEILKGGDVHFNEKCLHVLDEYRKSNKTIIMSSHKMKFLKSFADRIIFLEKGKLIAFGPAEEVIDIYINRKF